MHIIFLDIQSVNWQLICNKILIKLIIKIIYSEINLNLISILHEIWKFEFKIQVEIELNLNLKFKLILN